MPGEGGVLKVEVWAEQSYWRVDQRRIPFVHTDLCLFTAGAYHGQSHLAATGG